MINATPTHIQLFGLADVPLIHHGDDLARIIIQGYQRSQLDIADQDVVIVAQKIVSKAEGRTIRLEDVVATEQARELATRTGRDPRFCQVVIDESRGILATKGKVIVTRHRLGFECTSAGVDKSNLEPGIVTVLPLDPDASARRLALALKDVTQASVAVIITDSFGRPDRDGSVGIAIGSSGLTVLHESQQYDLYGNILRPRVALVDELAAAASLIMGQGGAGFPVVVARGLSYAWDDVSTVADLLFLNR